MVDDVGQLLEAHTKEAIEVRFFRKLWRKISGRYLIFFLFLVLFITSIILFARLEAIPQGKAGPYFESLYWLITTAATVGYGDNTPLTFGGKVLALVVMILGVSLLGFLLSQITRKIVTSHIGDIFGVNRKKTGVDYVICGWNNIAQATLEELRGENYEIVVIANRSNPQLARADDVHYVNGNPVSKNVLLKANIVHAKNVLLSMESDSDVLLAIHVIREISPWVNIVARINNHEHIALAEEAGADHVVSPASIGARMLAIASHEPNVVGWVTSSITSAKGTELREYDVVKGSTLAGKQLSEVQKRLGKTGKVLGIDTSEGFERVPSDDYELKVGDHIIMLIDKERFVLT